MGSIILILYNVEGYMKEMATRGMLEFLYFCKVCPYLLIQITSDKYLGKGMKIFTGR